MELWYFNVLHHERGKLFPLKEMKSGATSHNQILVFIMKLQSQLYQGNFTIKYIMSPTYVEILPITISGSFNKTK